MILVVIYFFFYHICLIFLILFIYLIQEIVIEGQDKVFKDVIEPLENVSVNVFPTSKGDIHELGSPKEVCHILHTLSFFLQIYLPFIFDIFPEWC